MKCRAVPADLAESARRTEAARIEFLLRRDGRPSTLAWVRRTLAIYRRALLDRRHFAHAAPYRVNFIASCVAFRHWLAANRSDAVLLPAQPAASARAGGPAAPVQQAAA